jgi:glucose-1-phosphate thymidylyltransferase
MTALILAAGYATRLYPLTENFPKPLLKVGDKTILDWLVDDIASCGLVDEYVIISNHKFAPHFQQWAAAKNKELSSFNFQLSTYKITVLDDGTSTNDTRLGAVRDIELAINTLKQQGRTPTDGYLVLAGDNVLDFSLTRFIRYAKDKGTSCIMRFHEPSAERLLKCGVVTIDDHDLVTEMTEKSPTPATHWACPPFYYYTTADADLVSQGIASGCGTDAPGSYIAWLCHQVPVHAMEMPGRRYDIGNLTSYEEVQRTYHGITVI